MKFEVTILGSGSSLPTVNRASTAQFVECNNRFLLIDCGEGTQIQLRRFKVKFQKISVILISHLHGDHYFGLPGLISSMHLLGREDQLNIYGPEGLKKLILPLIEAGGHSLNFEIHFHELKFPEEKVIFEDKKIRVHCFPLKHRIPTHGFMIVQKNDVFKLNKEFFDEHELSLSDIPKIKKGLDIINKKGLTISNKDLVLKPNPDKRYAFCSDTIYHEELCKIVAGVDAVYHEATFTNEHASRAKKTFHTTAAQAAQIAKKAKAKKLIIGHFSPRYSSLQEHSLEAIQIFENTVLAEDGLVISL